MLIKKNIILIGRTGNGKSTVANVLCDADKFEEGKYGVSQTEDTQIEEVEISGTIYRIIDTVGIGDTRLSEDDVLNRIAEAAYSARDGLHQIFFVTKDRFTKEEIEVYKILRKVIFDKNVVNYTTIIKTNFPYFDDEDECEEDKERMISENEDLSKVIQTCRKVIHVDNPPINVKSEKKRLANMEEREKSKKILRTCLATCQDVYRPANFDELNKRVGKYMSRKEHIKRLLKDKNLSKEEKKRLLDELFEVDREIVRETKGFFETITSFPGKVLDKTFEGTVKVFKYTFSSSEEEEKKEEKKEGKGFFETATSLPGKLVDTAVGGAADIVKYPFEHCITS